MLLINLSGNLFPENCVYSLKPNKGEGRSSLSNQRPDKRRQKCLPHPRPVWGRGPLSQGSASQIGRTRLYPTLCCPGGCAGTSCCSDGVLTAGQVCRTCHHSLTNGCLFVSHSMLEKLEAENKCYSLLKKVPP